ncbi:hypothetical protein MKZ38_000510 [Zalerion maritima]|uniref:Glycosyltransferase 2-like domain-containing protein n=1 Tax=Zalerion maritima TaxID=339359 RepID=A0AAD5WMP0_9PEZI|nr:hypothetical protein MKZ38_000510 [Zalerion maritima]
MGIFLWCSRRAGGISMIALAALSYLVISKEAAANNNASTDPTHHNTQSGDEVPYGAGYFTLWFAYYCLLIHTLVFIFPLRACWSILDISRQLGQFQQQGKLGDYSDSHLRRSSTNNLSSYDSLECVSERSSESSSTCRSSFGSDAGEAEREPSGGGQTKVDRQIVHAIVIPNYKEETDTLRETLEVLATHSRARDWYDVYLAMEQREISAEAKAASLISEFAKKFRGIDYTIHPSGIFGESAGKGSNIAWAARKLSERYHRDTRADVVVTGIDADSHLRANYFEHLTSMHYSYPETANTTLYAVPIVFDRNAQNVPAMVRVADILWAAAGMSGLYRGSTIAPPTSAYSLSLQLVDRVCGWDCDAEAIGEDLHMYLKCFFALNGNLTVRTILSPVSQCNVTGGNGKGLKALYADIRARYKQAQRHMWGSLDTGYVLRKFVEIWQERGQTARAFRPLHQSLKHEDNYLPHGMFVDAIHDDLKTINYERVLYLFHRLFEAHFLPTHMTILILSSTLLIWATEGNSDPHHITWIFDLCNLLRIAGLAQVALYLYLYESFHRICVTTREKQMNDAGLSDGMCFAHRSLRHNLVDYFMAPLAAPIYGSIPCAQAQVCHFWTLDLVYAVSKKAVRQRHKALSADELMA